MNSSRVLVLPGSSSPFGSEKYQQVYTSYRGQTGPNSGSLSYQSAVEDVVRACADWRPTWLVARSFGCHVAAGALTAGGGWISECRGVVLWGPVLSHIVQREYSTESARLADMEGHRKYGVFLASDFHNSLPGIEELIPKSRCNLRFCRGSKDDLNSIGDLHHLATLHAQAQRIFHRDVFDVVGVGHSVLAKGLDPETREAYRKCLFDPIYG